MERWLPSVEACSFFKQILRKSILHCIRMNYVESSKTINLNWIQCYRPTIHKAITSFELNSSNIYFSKSQSIHVSATDQRIVFYKRPSNRSWIGNCATYVFFFCSYVIFKQSTVSLHIIILAETVNWKISKYSPNNYRIKS